MTKLAGVLIAALLSACAPPPGGAKEPETPGPSCSVPGETTMQFNAEQTVGEFHHALETTYEDPGARARIIGAAGALIDFNRPSDRLHGRHQLAMSGRGCFLFLFDDVDSLQALTELAQRAITSAASGPDKLPSYVVPGRIQLQITVAGADASTLTAQAKLLGPGIVQPAPTDTASPAPLHAAEKTSPAPDAPAAVAAEAPEALAPSAAPVPAEPPPTPATGNEVVIEVDPAVMESILAVGQKIVFFTSRRAPLRRLEYLKTTGTELGMWGMELLDPVQRMLKTAGVTIGAGGKGIARVVGDGNFAELFRGDSELRLFVTYAYGDGRERMITQKGGGVRVKFKERKSASGAETGSDSS